MKGRYALGVAAAAVAAWMLSGAPGARAEEMKVPDPYTIPLHERHFEFSYTVDIAQFAKDAQAIDVWIPLPPTDANQQCTIRALRVAAAADVHEDEPARDAGGNVYAHFALSNFAAHASPRSARGGGVIELVADVTRREYIRKDFRNRGDVPLSQGEKKELADFLEPDRLVPIDGKIAEIAKQIAGDETNVVNLARRFYDHVLATMKYDKPPGQPWGRGDALWACDSKYGNCSDFHACFIGLCRSRGIPARFSIGFAIPERRGAGEIGGYHCWAEFFVAGYGWVPVDISEARKHPEMAEYYFGAHTEDRVRFTTGRDLTLVPPQKGEPLNFMVYPYAEVDGKPWDGVKRRFGYRDLE